MKHHTETEENYLKAIFRFSKEGQAVSTNTIANFLGTSAASVTDMFIKLGEKNLVEYTPYRGVRIKEEGSKVALKIVRKHRLWEVFLVQKLHFSWDNIHDVAEQLEHIDSPELIQRLDEFLGYPKFDPHGDPIPSESGEIEMRATHVLKEVKSGAKAEIAAVVLSSADFLQYLDRVGLTIGQEILVEEQISFDDSMLLGVNGTQVIISGAVAKNLRVVVLDA
jgi:DtxR family transcriptional regulator, Mn-dependent transcriptional regulator